MARRRHKLLYRQTDTDVPEAGTMQLSERAVEAGGSGCLGQPCADDWKGQSGANERAKLVRDNNGLWMHISYAHQPEYVERLHRIQSQSRKLRLSKCILAFYHFSKHTATKGRLTVADVIMPAQLLAVLLQDLTPFKIYAVVLHHNHSNVGSRILR